MLFLFLTFSFIVYLNHDFFKPRSLQALVIGAPVSPGSLTPAVQIRMIKLSGAEGYADVPALDSLCSESIKDPPEKGAPLGGV